MNDEKMECPRCKVLEAALKQLREQMEKMFHPVDYSAGTHLNEPPGKSP